MPPAERPACVGPELTEVLEAPEAWVAGFQARQALVARDLIDPGLLATLIERCRAGRFVDDHVGGIGSRQVEAPQRVGRVLNLVLSRPNFLAWVERATGARPLAKVEGRVVQLRANGADQLAWHNDMDGRHRRLGVTIDLSDAPCAGGTFELRETSAREPLLRFDHDQPGTALIFTVSEAFEHRVLPLTSGGPRRVFSGWFFDSERA